MVYLRPEDTLGARECRECGEGHMCLHNVLCIAMGAAARYCPPGYASVEDKFGNVRDGAWRQEGGGGAAMPELQGAKECRRSLSIFFFFFFKEGQVAWQWNLPGLRGVH